MFPSEQLIKKTDFLSVCSGLFLKLMPASGAGDDDLSPAPGDADFLAALRAFKVAIGPFLLHRGGEGQTILLQIDPEAAAFLPEGIPKGKKLLIFRPALGVIAGKGAEHH